MPGSQWSQPCDKILADKHSEDQYCPATEWVVWAADSHGATSGSAHTGSPGARIQHHPTFLEVPGHFWFAQSADCKAPTSYRPLLGFIKVWVSEWRFESKREALKLSLCKSLSTCLPQLAYLPHPSELWVHDHTPVAWEHWLWIPVWVAGVQPTLLNSQSPEALKNESRKKDGVVNFKFHPCTEREEPSHCLYLSSISLQLAVHSQNLLKHVSSCIALFSLFKQGTWG